jgi:hypothetical protein
MSLYPPSRDPATLIENDEQALHIAAELAAHFKQRQHRQMLGPVGHQRAPSIWRCWRFQCRSG